MTRQPNCDESGNLETNVACKSLTNRPVRPI